MSQLSGHNTVRQTNRAIHLARFRTSLVLYYLHKLDTLKDSQILQHCTNTVRFSHRRLKDPRLWDYAVG
jgi:hypothetical protein